MPNISRPILPGTFGSLMYKMTCKIPVVIRSIPARKRIGFIFCGLERSELITNLLHLSGQVKFCNEIILSEKISKLLATSEISHFLTTSKGSLRTHIKQKKQSNNFVSHET